MNKTYSYVTCSQKAVSLHISVTFDGYITMVKHIRYYKLATIFSLYVIYVICAQQDFHKHFMSHLTTIK